MTRSVLLTRYELFKQVWSEPMTNLAKKYGIFDYELRKVCKNMAIPVPKLGHWQRIRAGKHIPLPLLPAEYNGEEEVDLKSVPKVGAERKLSPVELLQKEIKAELKQVLQVPSKLTNPDALTTAIKEYIEKNNYTDYSTGLTFIRGSCFDLNVSKQLLSRSLRLIDTFIKTIRARGHRVELSYSKAYFFIGEEKHEFALQEKTKRSKEMKPGNYAYDYTPTGILIIKTGRFYYQKEWADGKQPLEKRLSHILASLEILAKERRGRLEESWKRNAEIREKERKLREHQELKEEELLKFKKLLEEAKRWRNAQMLREYINALDQQSKASGTPSKELEDWLKWAQKKTNWYDTSVNGYDEILSKVDKETLTFRKQLFNKCSMCGASI